MALIINLLSQVTGYLANKYDIEGTLKEISKLEKKSIKGNQKCIKRSQNACDSLTKWFNILSFLSLATGIILLILFIIFKV